MTTKTTAGQWGNSVGIRLSERIVEETDIRAGSPVTVRVVPEGVLIEKRGKDLSNLSLKELVELADPAKRHDLVWDDIMPVGREVW